VSRVAGANKTLEICLELERKVNSDKYFTTRGMMANIDLYPGCVFKALDVPPTCFTILLAVPKFGGWLAHWREYLTKRGTPEAKIVRPRQVYDGYSLREFTAQMPPITASIEGNLLLSA